MEILGLSPLAPLPRTLDCAILPFDLAGFFIHEAERELGAKLPVSYKAAMARANGGEIEALGDVWQLHPIAMT